MIRSIIVAVASNGMIGKDNRLVWRLPDDMKFFKETTMGHHVLMGRKNYESIPTSFRPFSGRTNIVISRNKELTLEAEVHIFDSLESGLDFAEQRGEEECFIIGGGQIYKESLEKDLVDKMYISEIDHAFDGDVFFPEFSREDWVEIERAHHPKDERHAHAFDYVTYVKKK
jgi:dihydrofolate reductase